MDLKASSLMSFIPWVVMALGSTTAGLLADGLVRTDACNVAGCTCVHCLPVCNHMQCHEMLPTCRTQLLAHLRVESCSDCCNSRASLTHGAHRSALFCEGAARRAGADCAAWHPIGSLPGPSGSAHGACKPSHLAAPGAAQHDGSTGYHIPR